MGSKITFQKFKERANIKHKNKFTYIEESFVNWLDYVSIICPDHGLFRQKARLHVELGWECRKCGINKQKISKRVSVDDFIKRSKAAHGEKFKYDTSSYNGVTSPIRIICPEHGDFIVIAGHHIQFLNFGGCDGCKKDGTSTNHFKNFIEKAKTKFSNFDYSKSEYLGCNAPIKIICPVHKEITITPLEHLRIGCFLCRGKKEDLWLSEIGVPLSAGSRQVRFMIDGVLKIVDGFDETTNTVYLFHGDYWHGNPKIYNEGYFNKKIGKTAGQLYVDTLEYEEQFRKNGFKVVSIWENDWENNLPSSF